MKKSLLVALVAGATLSSCIKDYIGMPGQDNDKDVAALTFEKIGTFSNGEGDEGFAEISAFDNSRGIGQNHLKIISIYNTKNAMACGLRFRSNYGKFFAHKGIHQSRFTHIGIAYNVYKAGFVLTHSAKLGHSGLW